MYIINFIIFVCAYMYEICIILVEKLCMYYYVCMFNYEFECHFAIYLQTHQTIPTYKFHTFL